VLWKIAVVSGVVSQITSVWSTQRPNSVTTTKSTISLATLVSVVLKVYFLLAKKLKTKAVVLEMMFATILSSPSNVNTINIPKSSAVFSTPTTRKRPRVCLLFMMPLVVFFDEIEWATLGLIEDTADIFADDPKAQKLYATEE